MASMPMATSISSINEGLIRIFIYFSFDLFISNKCKHSHQGPSRHQDYAKN